jgi:hypothetical protein
MIITFHGRSYVVRNESEIHSLLLALNALERLAA